MKRILTNSLIALLCGLLVLGIMQSVLGALITFVLILCLGLSPQDFGIGRRRPEPQDTVLDRYFEDEDLTPEERASFIDIPAYKEPDRP